MTVPLFRAAFTAGQAQDRDDFGSNRSKIMNVIDSSGLEHDVFRKPLRTFRHHAQGSTTGAQSTCSMRVAPVASMASRSKPSATPLAAGIFARAARKSGSIG